MSPKRIKIFNFYIFSQEMLEYNTLLIYFLYIKLQGILKFNYKISMHNTNFKLSKTYKQFFNSSF